MPSERRSEQSIRHEIAAERDQLAAALEDLRQSIAAKRRPAAAAGATLAVVLVAAGAVKILRRLKLAL